MIDIDAPVARRRKLQRYIETELEEFGALAKAHPSLEPHTDAMPIWMRRTNRAYWAVRQEGYPVPEEFLRSYRTPKMDMLPAGVAEGQKKLAFQPTDLMLKYQIRGYNLLREYLRYIHLVPEILNPKKRYSVLELSAGSGAGQELAQTFGNRYTATDYMTERGSAYRPLHEELGIEIVDFDGSQTPYKFKANSCDVVLCFQAIDAYGQVEDYPKFITEMARIAKRRVALVFNARKEGAIIDVEGALVPIVKDAFPDGRFCKTRFPNLHAFVLDTGGF